MAMKTVRVLVFAIVLVLLGSCVCSATCAGGDRYADLANGTVMDCNTGLIWLKNEKCTQTINGAAPYSDGTLMWYDAMRWVAGLKTGLCGLEDDSAAGAWRLPTKTELMAMVAYAKQQGYTDPTLTNDAGTAKWGTGTSSFTNVQSADTWSSTTTASSLTYAWFIYMQNGNPDHHDKASYKYVWPVRGVQAGSFDTVVIQ